MNGINTKISEIEKGCGSDKDSWEDEDKFTSEKQYICGEDGYLCNLCQATLSATKETARLMIDEFIKLVKHNEIKAKASSITQFTPYVYSEHLLEALQKQRSEIELSTKKEAEK